MRIPRAVLGAAAVAMLVSACGGSDPASPVRAGAQAPVPTVPAPTLAPDTTAAPAPASTAPASTVPASTVPASTVPAKSVLPDVIVHDVAKRTTISLASLVPARQPMLVWFWAPH